MNAIHVKQFKELYRRHTGVTLDDATAKRYAEVVLGFVREVAKDDDSGN